MQSKKFWCVFMEMKIHSESEEGWSDPQEQKSVAGKQEPGVVKKEAPQSSPIEAKILPTEVSRPNEGSVDL